MSFGDKPFAERFAAMGDETEGVFEYVCATQGFKFIRTGFNRPDLDHFETVPKPIRMTPDYILEIGRKHWYVECKGTHYNIKIKQETLDGIEHHGAILPVLFFVYNSVEDGYAFLTQEELLSIVETHGVKKKFQSDQKVYYELPRSAIRFTKEFQSWQKQHERE